MAGALSNVVVEGGGAVRRAGFRYGRLHQAVLAVILVRLAAVEGAESALTI